MSKRPRIRLRNQDIDLIRKLNKSVSQKKSRLRKNFGIDIDLPTKPAKDFSTRKEFNEYVEQAKSFTNRFNPNYQYVKNQHGEVFTKKEVNEVKRAIKEINRKKKKAFRELERKAFKHRGKETGFNVGDKRFMGDTRFDAFQPLRFNKNRFRDRKEFEDYRKNILGNNYRGNFIERRHMRYKQNYLRALENVFGRMADPLKEHIQNMTPSAFVEKYYTENLADISFIYDYFETQVKYQHLESVFGL